MINVLASFSTMGQEKARLLDEGGILRLELFMDGEWARVWESPANGIANRKSGFRRLNEYINNRCENYPGLDLVS